MATGVAHRGHLLEADGQAAARGVFDRLFGHVGEVVVLDTVNEEESGYVREHNDARPGRPRVRGPGGLLKRSQRGVALEALRESGSSFGAEAVVAQTEHGNRGGC